MATYQEIGTPTRAQIEEIALLRYTTGRRIEEATAVEIRAVIIPAAWGWKLTADDPDPTGPACATVLGFPVIPADVAEPMLAFR